MPADMISVARTARGARSGEPPGMKFAGILFRPEAGAPECLPSEAPAHFADLNLDQIVAALVAGREEYELRPFLHAPLATTDAIGYRHDAFRDLERAPIQRAVTSFAQQMRSVRASLAQAGKLFYPRQKEAWFLEAVALYGAAVRRLASELARAAPRSAGLCGLRDYLAEHIRSPGFMARQGEAEALEAELAAIRYAVLVEYGGFTVREYSGEPDYAVEIEATFAKFAQGEAKSYLVDYTDRAEMNHIEAAILDFVARLHPAVFDRLAAYRARHEAFLDPVVARFDREAQFYLAYLDYIAPLKAAGLPFCYPEVTNTDKAVHVRDGFDLALAKKLVAAEAPVVCNDFELQGAERIIVVSGPNQGGKTTFARSFGQLHYLASLGCPVPGRAARLFLCDRLFTHFEKEESLATLRGRLEDELFRMHEILARASGGSIIVINEIFTSTTLRDAVFLSREVLGHIIGLDALCVCVTFIDELTTLGRKTVSMVSTVVPDSPAERTFRIVRRPADGLAYAMAIAEKYRLTYERLRERIPA